MAVDIYIREREGTREIRVPWLPEKINHDSGGVTVATYDIIDKGEVAVPTGSGLSSWSWESELPGSLRTDTSLLRGTWKDPKEYLNLLEDWRQNGTPLRLLVTGYPINADVILFDYSSTPSGAFGDIAYDVTFKEDRDITITSTTDTTQKRPTTSSSGKTYTVKKGDTLWAIAKKFYGNGSKWKTIYNANKTIIENTAKARWKAAGINRDSQNGHWIFPGTKLQIP